MAEQKIRVYMSDTDIKVLLALMRRKNWKPIISMIAEDVGISNERARTKVNHIRMHYLAESTLVIEPREGRHVIRSKN